MEGIESLAFDDSPTEEEPEYSDVVTEQKNGSLFAVDFNFNVIEYTADENVTFFNKSFRKLDPCSFRIMNFFKLFQGNLLPNIFSRWQWIDLKRLRLSV